MVVDFVALVCISFTGISQIIHNIQNSKCTSIRFGCSGISCERYVKKNDDNDEDRDRELTELNQS